jgi:hypothetical protein
VADDPSHRGRSSTRPSHRSALRRTTGVGPPTDARWANNPTVAREDPSRTRSVRSASWDGGDTGRDVRSRKASGPHAPDRRSSGVRERRGSSGSPASTTPTEGAPLKSARDNPRCRDGVTSGKPGTRWWAPRARLPGDRKRAFRPWPSWPAWQHAAPHDHYSDRASSLRGWDRPVEPDPDNLTRLDRATEVARLGVGRTGARERLSVTGRPPPATAAPP